MTAHDVGLVEQITFVLGRHDPGDIFVGNPDAPPDEYESEAEAIVAAARSAGGSYSEVRAVVAETLGAAFPDVKLGKRRLRAITNDVVRVYGTARD